MIRGRAVRALRRRLIAGMIVIAPVTITGYVLWWIFQSLDGLLGRFLYPALGRSIPGLGLLILLLVLVAVGWAAERALGARILAAWNTLLDRLPFARRIYGAANRILRTVFGEEPGFVGKVVLIEYPAPGRWSIGFLTAPAPGAVLEHVPDSVTVFVAKPPNPLGGYLVIVPRASVVYLPLTIEEAVTYVLSVGGVTPAAREP